MAIEAARAKSVMKILYYYYQFHFNPVVRGILKKSKKYIRAACQKPTLNENFILGASISDTDAAISLNIALHEYYNYHFDWQRWQLWGRWEGKSQEETGDAYYYDPLIKYKNIHG